MHYHVMNGNAGCLPDNNETIMDAETASRVFMDMWQDFVWTEPDEWPEINYRDIEKKKEVNADLGCVVVKHGGLYYLELSPCEDVSCEEEDERERQEQYSDAN